MRMSYWSSDVCSSDLAAVPEVTVTVAAADGKFTEDVVSDAQGGFTVETPGPGDYVVKVDPEKVPPGVRVPEKAEEGVSITLPSDKIVELKLRLTESVYGTILNQDGEAKTHVAGVQLVFTSSAGEFTASSEETTSDLKSLMLPSY